MRAASQKPELILKRANDIVNLGSGNSEKEKRTALESLHTAISVKKKNVWSKSFEVLMYRHIELCVDLRDNVTAKDGLHQYRNLCIHTEPSSLENVITFLIDSSEKRLSEAKRRANLAVVATAARVADLEQEESPESIMLSSMTDDGSNERTDRELVVPWLKFAWENYRSALELLSRLPKMEKTYHDLCRRAFQFCGDYNRKTEFRRLCEMLRNQLELSQKPQAAVGKVAKVAFEWTPENVELHMQTKFEQLDRATAMELWNEAFRTIEDISKIISKKGAKQRSMLIYYEKLSKIFTVADNKLFHAYAILKLYILNTAKSGEEKQALASAVLLAALSVPQTATVAQGQVGGGGVIGNAEDDEYHVDRNAELAALLDFHSVNPTRTALLQEVVQRGIAAAAFPEFHDLYQAMEVDSSPFKLVKKIGPALQLLSSLPNLQLYALALEKNVVVKYVQHLSRVYSSVRLSTLYSALSPLKALSSRSQVERVLLDAVRHRLLAVRVSHLQDSVTFVQTTGAVSAVDTQIAQVGQLLYKAQVSLQRHLLEQDSETAAKLRAAQVEARKQYFAKVVASFDDEYGDLLERRRIIEQRKEDLERQQIEREEDLKKKREADEARRQREEEQRKLKEERERQEEKRRKEQEEVEVTRITAELRRLGTPKERSEVASMTPAQRHEALKQAEQAFRKKKEEEKKQQDHLAKSVDYRVRAERLESFSKAERRQQRWHEEDEVHRARATEVVHAKWATEHAVQLAEKLRLAKLEPIRASFERGIIEKQQGAYRRFREEELRRLLRNARDANVAQARKQYDDEQARIEEEERQRRLEEEQRILEAKRHEALRLQREAEERAEREREQQRQTLERMKREAEEALEKERKNRDVDQPPPAPAATAPKAAYQPPRPGAAGSASPAAAPAAASGGRYVPPSRQQSQGEDRGDTWRTAGPPSGRDRDRERERERDAAPAAGSGSGGWGRGGASGSDRRSSGGFGDRDRERERERERPSDRGEWGAGRSSDRDRERGGGFERKKSDGGSWR